MSELVLETEFASGVTVTNHVAHGVVDRTSEGFLTVGVDGFKLSGVQDAINSAVNALDSSVSAETTSKHVSIKIDETDGKLTAVELTDSDIASQTKLDELSGKSVTAVAMTGGTAAIAANETDGTKKITINTDGSQINLTGYVKGSASGAVESTDSVNAAISKLENQIVGKIEALDATVSGESADHKVNVKVTEADGVITAVDVVGTDIASASGLSAEIAARKAVDGQNGDTYAANTSANYINNAGSLNDADVKLDAQAKVNADNILKNKVNAGNGISVAGGTSTTDGTTVSVKLDTATYTGGNALVADSNGLRISTIDCGEY